MKKILLVIASLLFLSISSYASNDENIHKQVVEHKEFESKSFPQLLVDFYHTTGISAFLSPKDGALNHDGEVISSFNQTVGPIIMIFISFLLFYLAIKKGFEPLLLIPIGFGGLLANIPIADISGPHGFIGVIYNMGLANEFFPILIFMGVGAMTDFGPLLANPKTAFLGGAAQS
jgi:oxaloacetate decarboxylase beta subunit